MKFMVINGPNINMIGVREKGIYGSKSFTEICDYIKEEGEKRGHEVTLLQSNCEGTMIDFLQRAYFEKFDGYICEIKTDNRILKFMFDINSFPHLIGLHHAFKGKKNRNEYKGAVGFEKIKNGEITYNDIMKGIKNGHSNISWVNIKNRIKYLPMFLNRLSKAKLLIRKDDLLCRKVFLKGNYFLYRSLYQNNYPILSLKDIDGGRTIIETFFVDNDLTLIGALKSEEIVSIKLIPPLKSTSPITMSKDTIPVG